MGNNKPEVDRDLCISCGLCEEICPEVFELDDEDICVIKEGADLDADCIEEAAEECPTDAIIT